MSATLDEKTSAAAAATPAPVPAVSLRHVSKAFRLPHEQYHTFKERALHPWRARRIDVLQAVRDVSLDIAPGEFFGIVGRNGSGKSTLLKCVAGIYRVDEGELGFQGRLSPFIELGVGFNPDLTARDNVIINAIMLGLSRKQAVERFDHIIEFAELEEFIDLKLKNYSSGMHVRLAFATAVQVDADILLIDEVLAVGDASFQQKCFDEFARLREQGRTILLVTHDMSAVERFCDRAMLLERGDVVEIGDPSTIARKYNHLNFSHVRAERGIASPELGGRRGKDAAEVLGTWFEDSAGEHMLTAEQGKPLTVHMKVQFSVPVEDPIFSITLQNEAGNMVFSTNTDAQRINTGRFDAGTTADIRIGFENRLGPGRYRLFATVAPRGLGADVFDAHITNSIIVLGEKAGGGLVDFAHSFEIDRG